MQSPHKLYQAKAQQISFHPSFNMSFLFMFILRNGLKSVANKHENCVRNILPINLHETGIVVKLAIQRALQLALDSDHFCKIGYIIEKYAHQ